MLDDAIEWKCSLSCYHWDNLTNIGRLGKPKVALLVSLINKQQELDSWSRACRAGGGGVGVGVSPHLFEIRRYFDKMCQ